MKKLKLYRDDKMWYYRILFGLINIKIAERDDRMLHDFYCKFTTINNINQDEIPNLLIIEYTKEHTKQDQNPYFMIINKMLLCFSPRNYMTNNILFGNNMDLWDFQLEYKISKRLRLLFTGLFHDNSKPIFIRPDKILKYK